MGINRASSSPKKSRHEGDRSQGTAEPAPPGRQCRPLEGVARSAAGVDSNTAARGAPIQSLRNTTLACSVMPMT